MSDNSRQNCRFSTCLSLQYIEIITVKCRKQTSCITALSAIWLSQSRNSRFPTNGSNLFIFQIARSDQSANIFFLDNWFSLFFYWFSIKYLLLFFICVLFYHQLGPWKLVRKGQPYTRRRYPSNLFSSRKICRGLEAKGVCRPSKS